MMILTYVSAAESPKNFADCHVGVNHIFMSRRNEIQRGAIALAVDGSSLEVAYMAANLFKFPWHGIRGAIDRELERPQGWTVRRLVESMPLHEEREQFLVLARCVNQLVDGFLKTEENLNAESDSLDAESLAFQECFQSIECRTAFRRFMHRQFWGYELQCRANVLRCLHVHCGHYVADKSPLDAANNYLCLLMMSSMLSLCHNEAFGLYSAMDSAETRQYHICMSMGVQMAPYWLEPDKTKWELSLFKDLDDHVSNLAEYCLGLSRTDTVWYDPWFQRVPVPLTKATGGTTDGYIDPTPEDMTVGTLPRLF